MNHPLTRDDAITLYYYRHYQPLDLKARPLAAGMGGCPWRVCLATILSGGGVGTQQAAKALPRLLEHWPDPQSLGSASELDVGRALRLRDQFAKGRTVVALSRVWSTGQWANVLELPGVGLRVYQALIEYC